MKTIGPAPRLKWKQKPIEERERRRQGIKQEMQKLAAESKSHPS